MRLSKKGQSVAVEVAFWWVPKDKAIHLASNDPEAESLHVAIRADPNKPSGHPYLFRELVKCLRMKGAPAPEDSETSN